MIDSGLMRKLLPYTLLFVFWINPTELIAQVIDGFGNLMIPWGATFEMFTTASKKSNLKHEISVDEDFNLKTLIVDYTMPRPPYKQGTQLHFFYNDSLVQVILNFDQTDPDRKDDLYPRLKKIFSETYRFSPQDDLLNSGTFNETLICTWEFEIMSIVLMKMKNRNRVGVLYRPINLPKRITDALTYKKTF